MNVDQAVSDIAALSTALVVLYYVALVCFWAVCRLTARPCPCCGEKWLTTLTGEWGDVEDWRCARCGHTWGHDLKG